MFSLGVLIFAIYNQGNALLQANHDWSTYKRNIQEVCYPFDYFLNYLIKM